MTKNPISAKGSEKAAQKKITKKKASSSKKEETKELSNSEKLEMAKNGLDLCTNALTNIASSTPIDCDSSMATSAAARIIIIKEKQKLLIAEIAELEANEIDD